MGKNIWVEYAVIGLYFIFMIATGFIFRRFNKNFGDYFRSGCRGTWWLVGASVFMASFTAWSFTGAAGAAYESGISVAVIFFANTFGYFINYLITAKLFRQMRATTGPEIILQRFNTTTQQFYVWVGLLPGIMMASLTLWGTALFTSAVFGYNLQYLIIIIGLVVMIYSVIGGSWSVMANDYLQALILVPMSILVAYLSLQSIGGFGNIISEVHRQNLPDLLSFVDHQHKSQFTPSWIAAMFCFVLIAYNSASSATKYFSCKDGKEAQKAALLSCILMLAGSILWFIPPIVARLQFSTLVESAKIIGVSKPGEASYALIAMKLLPVGLSGMIVVTMFAATMSSLAPGLNQFAAIITQDVYKPFIHKKASEKEVFLVGQLSGIITGFLYIFFALYFSKVKGAGLFDYMLKFGSLFGTPMAVPLFLMLFIRKTPPRSAIVSILFSFVVSILAYLYHWPYEWTVFTIVAVGTISFLLTSFDWKKTPEADKQRIEAFYIKMHTPVDFEKEVGKPNDPGQLKLVGYVSLSIGLFLTLLLFVPNPIQGKYQIVFVSGFILLFGISMILTGIYKEKQVQPVFPAKECLDDAD